MNKKNLILEAAAKLFSEKGFRETPMAEISRITGAAEGTIFYHFKNKEQLFVAILEDFKRHIIEDFKSYAGQTEFKTGLEMLEGVISFYFHLAGTMEDRFLLLHRHDLYELKSTLFVEDTSKRFSPIFSILSSKPFLGARKMEASGKQTPGKWHGLFSPWWTGWFDSTPFGFMKPAPFTAN
jgi:AcrR family transcriptional regulator